MHPSRPLHSRLHPLAAAACLGALPTLAPAADPTPTIARAGLLGAPYIGPDGVNTTDPVPSSFPALPLPGPLDPSPISGGRILGQSIRWVLDDPRTGNTYGFTVPFLYISGVCTPLGLHDGQHLDSSGGTDGSVASISSTGWIIGGSTRYSGDSTNIGLSAWVRSPAGATSRIGFSDFDHTLIDGTQYSRVRAVNDAGIVVGSSARRDVPSSPVSYLNQDAWYYNPAAAQTTRIGLTSAEYTAAGGVHSSSVRSIDNAGRILGSSERFTGDTDMGVTPWLMSTTTGQTTPLGLTGPDYTRVDGFRSSAAVTMNASGQVIGTSLSYLPLSLSSARAAWIFDGAATRRIGFTDAAHTDLAGRQNSDVRAINASGQVLGVSARYVAGTTTTSGASVWIDSGPGAPNPLVRIGLFDAAHTNLASTADQVSSSRFFNDAGQAAGTSRRYIAGPPGNDGGQDPWFYDGAITRPITIHAPKLVSPGGYQYSTTQALNSRGQVIGTSEKFGATSENPIGLIGWFFDPSAASASAAILDFATSSGNRVTNPQVLTAGGLVVGSYTVDRADAGDIGTRVFLWTPGGGRIDIDQLIPGGLPAAGWQWLSSVTKVSDDGTTLIGKGRPVGASTDEGMYVLTIPGPATAAIVISATLPTMRRRRRPHK